MRLKYEPASEPLHIFGTPTSAHMGLVVCTSKLTSWYYVPGKSTFGLRISRSGETPDVNAPPIPRCSRLIELCVTQL